MRHEKNFCMIYNILKTIPFIFHPFQQLNYSLGVRGEKFLPNMEQEINHFGAIKKIGCFLPFF